jgi:hypothetical protein
MIALRSDTDHMRCNAHSLLPVAQIGEMELAVGGVFAHARRVFDHRAAGGNARLVPGIGLRWILAGKADGAALGMRRDFAPF